MRRQRVVAPLSPTRARLGDGREVVNFASNNYLGLTHHPRLIAAATAAVQAAGGGAGAAGLITGHTHVHAAAQDALARWKGTEAALLLPSGYQANLAVVQTLAAIGQQGGGIRFLVDKLAHASLIDAARATGAEMRVYPHNTLAKLERLLAEAPEGQLQVVLTESIFSMDGDAADLRGLADLKRRFGFVLVLDEAHGSGVYGPAGAGYAAELSLGHAVDVTVVTLSKAIGSAGGAICASANFCAAVLNHGRAYVYSTHVTPATAAWATEAIAVMADEPGPQARVREVSRHVRAEIGRMGFDVPAGDSPIVPVILGDEAAALAAADQLLAVGLLAPAVRPPTVPRGGSRLRVTVSAAHSDADVGRLIEALRGLVRPM
ncbi:MAG: aminotransferase class I/II-fold pyridoxal phosphate-dependent enzyme [Phycisphaerae bacterium]